ncbi:serine carboxypeptidase-like 25 [Impatiens glandulifera]|uniref:serine carboxypeptidase-like 25 n=1 Tax=Impatiens glandulifera TaxID=253017 RepID=UPI001FB05B5A|nr:serine carboxypeptidase-like 25 [Impatiens glandulifera]
MMMKMGKTRDHYFWVVFVLVVLLLLFQYVGGSNVEDEEEADRIRALPGQPNVSFHQFSGYVTVNQEAGRALFYWLTESSSEPSSSKPLVIWLNGGPGCSSVAYGASEEIGPFRINNKASGLNLNPFSWNSVANLLFLESPAGVGFSYTNTSTDLVQIGDRRTAMDSLTFLVRWMERFPRYKTRQVFLAGESYAGHYVPQFAREILAYNANSDNHPIHLKGIMIGNGVMDNYYDNIGTVNYWWSHAMISDQTFHQLINTCHFSGQQKESNECETTYNYAMDQELGNIDPYNIYAIPCPNKSNGTTTSAMITTQTTRLPHRPHKLSRPISGYDPCTESYAETYYNRPDVQKALHANTTRIPYKWTACSEKVNRNWNDSDITILPIYRQLIAAQLRIWLFSGDVDSVVPVTATRYSLAQLRLTTKISWYPWYVRKQVGGWTEVYDGLTFATVRGAGHEVPLFKPRAALQLFKSFLRGDPLPKS